MGLVVEVLECICLILAGAVLPGWVIVGLAVIALLFAVLGGFPIGHR